LSVTVKRSTQPFSYLLNITVKMQGTTIDRLAPGESVTFEVNDPGDTISLKYFFSSRDVQVADGDTIELVRNNKVMALRILSRFILAAVILVTGFRLITSLTVMIPLATVAIILSFYIDFFIPDYLVVKTKGEKNDRL